MKFHIFIIIILYLICEIHISQSINLKRFVYYFVIKSIVLIYSFFYTNVMLSKEMHYIKLNLSLTISYEFLLINLT